jgi:LmbE family N-acetylglucosaminyl deacetylase
MFKIENVLVLGAHPDDIEFGMGGTLAKLKREEGINVKIIVFSNCDTSLPLGFEPGTLIKECRESLSTYGFTETDIEFFDFPVRNFDKFRQEILEKLILIYRSQTFDTVFFPGSTDTHQDHSVLSQEAIRACKKSTMLGYEMSWNSFGSKKNFFFEILEEDLTKKVKSIKKYASQAKRLYATKEAQVAFATATGIEIGKELAEGFELIRAIAPA